MPDALDQLVEKLRNALGQDLVSVVLYGSAAVGDHHGKFSDYNVLCVLRIVAPAQLAATETVFRWWREKGNPAPLLLTEDEVRTSTDCFAIEFHDIKEHHRILFGADLVSSLTVDRCFYRAQVEHDLRARLLRVRQKSSGVLSDKDVLCRLLVDSVSTFCVLFRHALILHGHDAPARKRDIIERARERFAIDPAPFNALLDQREERSKPKEMEPQSLLAAYLNEIGKVIDAVDRLEKEN
jgi:predicted nucleotidyltransferase